MVKPKKHLGQHFLKDDNICRKIADSITGYGDYKTMVEIGPGTGALTKHLLLMKTPVEAMEVDTESIDYLKTAYPDLTVHNQDFLRADLSTLYNEPIAVVGNFPYNISSQILFVVLKYRTMVPEVVGMFQKEVAERICEPPGSKQYGILSVFVQAFYDVEYLFTVSETVFDPPPKVKSGVIRLKRKPVYQLGCDEDLFFKVVKQAFNQRRKTLRNSLKSMGEIPEKYTGERPEQLGVGEFVEITRFIDERTV